MTLEEILKKRGYTDADLASMQTLLSDSRFRSSLEAEYGAVAQERDQFKTNLEAKDAEIEEWRTTVVNPQIARAEQEAAKVRLEAAELRERARLAEDYGLVPAPVTPPAPPSVTAGPEAFDPQKHNLVTRDDIGRFAELEGQAIAMAADISEEYRHLTGGKSLYEYVAPDGSRGMSALRAEASKSKKKLSEYVAEKFDFVGKRAEIERKRQEEHDALVAKEAVTKFVQENGANPNTRSPVASRAAFIPTPQGTSPAGGAKQPWEVPDQVRRNSRQERALTRVMTDRVH